MNYNCEHCGHQFKQKIDLQRHLTKKNGCIPVNHIMEKKEQQTTMNGKIQELMNVNSESKLALDKKVSQHRMQVQKVTHELIELKQANTKMKEEFREMRELQEKKIKDLKSKLKIKSDAYHQLQLDTSTMKTQLQGLQGPGARGRGSLCKRGCVAWRCPQHTT